MEDYGRIEINGSICGMFDDQSSKLQMYLFALSSNSRNLIHNRNFPYFISEEIKLYEMVGKNFTLLYKVLYRN